MADEPRDFGAPADAKPPKVAASADAGPRDFGAPTPAAPREESILPQNDILANSPDDTMVSSALKLAGTAISRAPFAPVGLPGDLRDLGKYAAQRLKSFTSGKPIEEVQRESEERMAKAREGAPSWMKSMPDLDHSPTTRDLSDKFLAQAGTKPYEPTSTAGKVAMGAIEGLAGARSAPGSGALARGAAPELALQTAAKTAPIAGVAGGVGAGVADVTGDPLLGAAAGVATAPVAAHGQQQASKHLPAVTKGQVSDLADTRIKDLATDPKASATAPIDNPLGTKATTGESVGDQGLIQATSSLAGVDPVFKGQVKKIEGEQNAKRVEKIEDLAHPNAKASDVVDHYTNYLQGLDDHYSAVVANAEKAAQSVAAHLPEGQSIDVLGGKLQETANARMKQARDLRNRAYEAVDPDGTMHVVGAPATSGAQKFLEAHDPSFGDLHPTVESLYKKVAGWKDVVPYKGVMQMDATINGAIGEARASQNHTVVDQLGNLKKLVKGAADKALENQVKWEQQQVAAGSMPQEQTIGYRLAEEAKAFRDARRSAGTSTALTGTGPATGVHTAPGNESAGGGPGVRPSTEGVAAEPQPNLDPAAAVAWTQAKQLHGDFSDTFRQGQVGDAIKGQYGRFDTPGSKVAQQAFVPGDAGAENVRNWMRADNGATDIPSTMADIAATRLREMMKGNEALTPEVLAAWKQKYAPALSAIDERVPGFSQRFDNAASATATLGDATAARTEALADYQKGIAKRFLGREGDDDVGTSIGKMITGDNSGALTREMMTNVAHNADARAGVQRAVVDWMLGKTSNAGILGGENIMSGAKFPRLVRERSDALRNIFGDAGYENITKVVDDLERSGAAQALAAEPNSNTAMKLKPLLESIGSNRDATIGSVMVAATVDAIAGGGLFIKALIPIMIGKAAWNHVKMAGIRNANDLVHQGLLHPEIGQAMLQRATSPDGKPNMAALSSLIRALNAQHDMGAQIVDDKQREGRAAGGSVRINPSAHAASLVREAEKIRKQHGTQTEALLKVPDEHIARALSVANGAING